MKKAPPIFRTFYQGWGILLSVSIVLLIFMMIPAVLRSQTLEELMAKGCPSPEKEWRDKEYADLYRVLKDQSIPLPKMNGEPAQAVFQRMVNTENLVYYQKEEISLEIRLSSLIELLDNANSILVFYSDTTRNIRIDREVSRLMVFELAVAALSMDLLQKYIPTLSKDEYYNTRMEGVERMKQLIFQEIDDAVHSLSERHFYTDASVIEIAAGIRKYYASFDPILPQAAKVNFRSRIENRIRYEKSQAVKDALSDLCKVIPEK